MEYTLNVENIKCGGCANTIQRRLSEIDGVESVIVDVEQGAVTVNSDEELRPLVTENLKKLGYPISGSVEGMGSVKAKAKSFVSCAIGRMEK